MGFFKVKPEFKITYNDKEDKEKARVFADLLEYSFNNDNNFNKDLIDWIRKRIINNTKISK